MVFAERIARSPGTFPSDLVSFFALSFAVAVAAVVLTYYFGADLLLWWKARNWAPAQCTVVQVEPSLVYRLEAGGRVFEAGRIDIGGSAMLPVGSVEVGSKLTCFYDPANPADAVLDREYEGWWWLPGLWALALFMVLSTGPSLAVALWKWATYRPEIPLTWGEWFATFYRDGAWMYSVIGLAALLPGLAMVWFLTARPWWNWWQASQWPETQCEMVRGEVRTWSGGSGRDRTGGYILDIEFRYEVHGRTFTATTYSPWRLGGTEWLLQSSRAEGIAELQQKFAPGTRLPCYVSPSDPQRAYLSRDRAGYATYVSCIGPFLVLLGLIVLCSRR